MLYYLIFEKKNSYSRNREIFFKEKRMIDKKEFNPRAEDRLIKDSLLYGDDSILNIDRIKKEPIKKFLLDNNISIKEFALKCNANEEEIKKLIFDEISIITIFQIEKIMGLERYSLIRPLKRKDIVFFD